MENWTILIAMLTLFLKADAQQPCLSALPGWKGTLYHPQMMKTGQNKWIFTNGEDTDNNCIYYLNTNLATDVKLSIAPVNLGNVTVKVTTMARNTNKWTQLYSVSGRTTYWDDVYAVGIKYMKIVTPKSLESLIVEYEMITCPPMPSSVKILACTKDDYHNSQCVLQCADSYYPRDVIETKFHAHCTKKSKTEFFWKFSSRSPDQACVAINEVDSNCFTETDKGTCPYNFEELLALKKEQFERPEKPIRQRWNRILQAPIRRLIRPPTFELLRRRCVKNYCSVNASGKRVPACGTLNTNRKKICMTCRYSIYRLCAANSNIGPR